MDPARWERLETLCLAALERPVDERAAWLDRECSDDTGLRRDVEALIAAAEQDTGFLERPLVDLASLAPEEPDAVPAGTTIGPWRVVRRLGRGGMGDVYLALRDTEDIRQQVALKIIRRGMDTEEVLRRFRLERRILASLHHPNIAALLDASATEDGRPYFVMEYVEGQPLDEYCRTRRLSVADRLRLFQTVCGAVEYAHRNLVVHRDLKPRNILVGEDRVPKLLDFGIGKVLAPSEALSPGVETRTDVRLLTPEYAAPEQVAGGQVTTATDVYGLGILLYELLTGRHPYLTGTRTVAEIERAVLEANPARPSQVAPPAVARALAGDLDTIILMALRKEPERRYGSVAALADDIARHLDGHPVSARPDTFRYRARKFVRRNAAWVGAAAIAFLALGATTVVTLVQSGRVRTESERVTAERDKALEVRSFLMEMFGASGANRAVGDTVTTRRLLDIQAERVRESYEDRLDLRATMMEVLADGYDRLGLLPEAEPLAREALDLRRRILPADHPDIAASLNLVGWITHQLGRSDEAEPILREAVAIRRAAGPRQRPDLSRSLNDLGVVLSALRRFDSAEVVLNEALAIREAELGPAHRSVGITANNLAAAYYYQNKLDDAIRVQEQVVRVLGETVGPDHQRTIVALNNLAAFHRANGDWAGAAATYRDLLDRTLRIQGHGHPVAAQVMIQLGSMRHQEGYERRDTVALADAGRLFRDAAAIYESTLGPRHPEVGVTLERLAGVEADLGRHGEALAAATRALELVRSALGEQHRQTATVLQRLAIIHSRMQDPATAAAWQRRTIATWEAVAGPDAPETARARTRLCEIFTIARDSASARVACAAADTTRRVN